MNKKRLTLILAAATILIAVGWSLVILIPKWVTTPEPTPTPQAEEPTLPSGPDAPGEAAMSVCSENWTDGSSELPIQPPTVEWEYSGTTAYPVSEETGPATESANAYRYCYAPSVEGALVMVANMATQTTNPDWIEYSLAPGPFHEDIASQFSANGGFKSDQRVSVAGFRILDYRSGESARVDLLLAAAEGGKSTYLSVVGELVWADGDWKLSADVAEPLAGAAVPSDAGYTEWVPTQ